MFSAYFMKLSLCLQTETLLKNMNLNSNSNSIKAASSNKNTASVAAANAVSATLQSASTNLATNKIFSMKHKKMRLASTNTAKKATNTATKATKSTTEKSQATTNIKVKAKDPSSEAMNASPDLLKQSGLLNAAIAATNQPGFKKRIDLEKLGPIIFQSWIKYFRYAEGEPQQVDPQNPLIRITNKKKFFTNNEYREQLKLYPGKKYDEQRDSMGDYTYISDPQKFYLVGFKNLAVIYSSKMVNYFFYIIFNFEYKNNF
jgi:hypothetical protein